MLLTALLVSWRARLDWWSYSCIGALLHVAGDFPVHHDDAHRHFFPLSDWRFASPVSYWDSSHYGDLFFPAELAVAAVLVDWLSRYYRDPVNKAVVGVLAVVLVGYIGFVFVVWM